MKTGAQAVRTRETWDRLVLLLITYPREGWESEFEEITRREIGRLGVSVADKDVRRE